MDNDKSSPFHSKTGIVIEGSRCSYNGSLSAISSMMGYPICLAVLFLCLLRLSGCAWITANPADAWLQERCEKRLDTPVSIGVLLPLSGKYEWYGRTVLDGVELGMKCFEPDQTGCNSFKLMVRDTAGSPEQAVSQLDDLVDNQKVVAVVGPMFSDESKAAAARAERLGIPLIAMNGWSGLTEMGSYVFRNFLTREAEVKLLVNHARQELGIETFAVLYPDDHDGQTFFKIFQAELEASGARVVKAYSYPPNITNFSPLVKRLVGRLDLEKRPDFVKKRDIIKWKYRKHPLKRERAMEKLAKQIPPIVDFEALFVPDVYEKVSLLAPALAFEDVVLRTDDPEKINRLKKTLGRDMLDMVYLFGTDGWNHPKLIEWAGRYLEGAIFCDGFYLDSQRAATRQFVDRFRAGFKRDPNTLAAHGYDTIRMLKVLLVQKNPCRTSEIRDALLDLKDFEGATGTASMNSNGELDKKLFLLRVQKGAAVELEKPPPVS